MAGELCDARGQTIDLGDRLDRGLVVAARVALGLPGRIVLEGSYLPPITVADAQEVISLASAGEVQNVEFAQLDSMIYQRLMRAYDVAQDPQQAESIS